MKITIINNSKEIKFLPRGNVMLDLGKNEVDKDKFNLNLTHPHIKTLLDKGIIEVKEEEGDNPSPSPKPSNNDPKKALKDKVNEGSGDKNKGKDNEFGDSIDPDDFTVTMFIENFVEDEDNADKLEDYLMKEKLGQNRTTLVEPIKERIEELS